VPDPSTKEGRTVNILAAAIQMSAEPGAVARNRDCADSLLKQAADHGAELAVLPEMFNTGYGAGPRYGEMAEDETGPTLRHLRERSRRWKMSIAAGFVEREHGHIYDSLAFFTPEGGARVYRKRHLVFWECSRFRKGREPVIVETKWGRVGLAICADMIYRRVWAEYQGRIDAAVIASAWPDFKCRASGKPHWLLGGLGPLSGELPRMVARNLEIPVVFANQCGETTTTVPILCKIRDRFSGGSAICGGKDVLAVRAGTEEALVMGPLTLNKQERGGRSCHSMSPSVPGAGSFISAG
jgi:N-carbamoylputrescine amidase